MKVMNLGSSQVGGDIGNMRSMLLELRLDLEEAERRAERARGKTKEIILDVIGIKIKNLLSISRELRERGELCL